jgi:hypothetical protein
LLEALFQHEAVMNRPLCECSYFGPVECGCLPKSKLEQIGGWIAPGIIEADTALKS